MDTWVGFKRHEFECKCGCGFSVVDAELLDVLKATRAHFNARVFIDSACRCEKHNKDVGGKPRIPGKPKKGSKHLLGIAADIVVEGHSPIEVHKYLTRTYPNEYGIGLYNTFVHVDVRPEKARW